MNQSKLPKDIPDNILKAWILSGVLGPLLMRTDLTLTAPEQLVLPQAARRTRITARRHRPWNITQETQPDAPMKTRPARWIHKYSVFSERLNCACAALGLPVSSSVLQLSLLFLTINFSFILLLNRKIYPLTLSSCMLKHYCLKSFRPLWTNWTVIRSLVLTCLGGSPIHLSQLVYGYSGSQMMGGEATLRV